MFCDGKLYKKANDHDLKRTIDWISTQTDIVGRNTLKNVYFEVQSRPKESHIELLATYRDGSTNTYSSVKEAALENNTTKGSIFSSIFYKLKTGKKRANVTWEWVD